MSDEEPYQIEVEMDIATVSVTGEDPDWVLDTFRDISEEAGKALKKYQDREDDYHVRAGAGYMIAHAHGNSPEDAFDNWKTVWHQMLDDVSELTEREREMGGIKR